MDRLEQLRAALVTVAEIAGEARMANGWVRKATGDDLLDREDEGGEEDQEWRCYICHGASLVPTLPGAP